MNKLKNYILNHKKISAIVFVLMTVILFKVFTKNKTDQEQFTVKRGQVVEKVIVSGKVKPVNDANLAFEKTGKVSRISVKVGDKVYAGQELISLDSESAYADYLKAKSTVLSEQAKLDELLKGATVEEVALRETEVSNARIALKNAENNLSNKIEDAYIKSDDAIRNNIDSLFSNPKSNNPQINIFITDTTLKNEINSGRYDIEVFLNKWALSDFSVKPENISNTEQSLYKMREFLDKVALAVNTMSSNSSLSQTTIDTYKSSVSSARTNITTAITNLSTAEEKYNTSKGTLAVAERNLAVTKSGSTEEQIKSQEARVLQYKAEEQRTLSELNKLSLRSPINGIVTKQDAKLGETVTSGSLVVSVISSGLYEIEANVSEVSVGKVSIGNKVSVTMDAFLGKVFYGKVSYIEPAETIVDGVVNYKTKILFDENYPEIKTGLTTSLDIETLRKDDVLVVPQYAVIKENDKNFVTVLKLGKEEKREVLLGTFGNDGMAEVLSGLSEGEVVIFGKIK